MFMSCGMPSASMPALSPISSIVVTIWSSDLPARQELKFAVTSARFRFRPSCSYSVVQHVVTLNLSLCFYVTLNLSPAFPGSIPHS